MSAAEIVVGVIAAFFIIGIVVGVIAVIAMSAIRTNRGRRAYRARTVRHGDEEAGWREPPGPDDGDDHRPRWPSGG